MKVITINEESHGYIGIAKDYYSAVSFLINNSWLTECVDVWDEHKENWIPLCEILGEVNDIDISKEIFSRFCVGK